MEKTTAIIIAALFVIGIGLATNYAGDYNKSQDDKITDEEADWVKDWVTWKLNQEVKHSIDSLNANVTIIKSKFTGYDQKLAVLEAKTEQPTTASTAPPAATVKPSQKLGLAVGGNDPGIFKIAFNRGEIVYITGQAEDAISNLKFEIINP